jgi:hypothetical protein
MSIIYIFLVVYIIILITFEIFPIPISFLGINTIQYSSVHSENTFPGSANFVSDRFLIY